MLEQKDLQSIGELLDKKLEKGFDEMGILVNKGFTDMQKEINEVKEEVNGVKEEIKLRPTKTEIFSWADRRIVDLELKADRRIVDLELKADRHDYLHINELDKLPPQPEISRALAERGLKIK